MPTSVPPKGDDFRRVNAHFANLKVYAQDAPDMTVRVTAGGFWIDEKTYVEFSGGNSSALIPPPGSAKWVVICLSDSGAIEVVDGDVAASPTVPDLPANRMPLCGVFLSSTDIEITSNMVFDLRPLWKVGAQISNVAITDVINLQTTLDDKVNTATFNSGLDSKADQNGTNEVNFILNKDQTGVPGSDVKLIIERGSAPNVDIRWNESSEKWEFTNDGTVWEELGSASIPSSTQNEIDANTAAAAANASAIGTLFSVGGSASASAISLNTVNIAANASAIGTVTGSVSANASTINILQIDVGNNDSDITNLQTSILGIATNTGAITTLQTNVGNNDTDISNLQSDAFNHDGTVAATGTFDLADNIIKAPELQDYAETLNSPVSVSGVLSIDLSLANVVQHILVENVTSLSFSNPPSTGKAGSFTLILKQDATGGRSIAWPASVKWGSGLAPALANLANEVNILTFMTVDGGTTWYGFIAGESMA